MKAIGARGFCGFEGENRILYSSAMMSLEIESRTWGGMGRRLQGVERDMGSTTASLV